MSSFLERLKERKLVQWAAAYVAGSWLMLQALDVIAGPWALPEVLQRSAQVLVLLGLFVTLVLAWYHGERGRQRVSGMELMLLTGVFLIGGALLGLTVRPEPSRNPGEAAPNLAATAQAGTPRVRLGILPPQLMADSGPGPGLSYLLQNMLAAELVGRRGIAVVDPQSLITRLAQKAGTDRPEGGGHEAGLDYALRIMIVPAEGGMDFTCILTDVRTGEVVATRPFRTADDALLPMQVREAAALVVAAVEERESLPKSLDLEPWLARAPTHIEATRAFLQGTEYAYRGLAGGREHYERALALDPGFIAPRVWLVSSLLSADDTAAARQHVARLQILAPHGSPFEQAMVGWAVASVSGDREAKARHLEVALGYSPDNNVLLYNLAGTLIRLGRVHEAHARLHAAVASGWRYAPLYTMWGVVSIETGRVDGLRATLEYALNIPTRSAYLYALLEALARFEGDDTAAGRYAASISAGGTDGVAALAAEMAPLYQRLAQLARERGRTAVAEALLNRAARSGGRHPE
ncbi:MAG TPA: hypothetical protein VMN60_01535 [Longimicrobiales bacterium]|nr:hypothetical protein [Longimicrobiales bacterium]